MSRRLRPWSLTTALILLTSCQSPQDSNKQQAFADTGVSPSKLPVHVGDVIFRRGWSLNSRAVLLADRDARFSHVGMVVATKGQEISVVHTVPAAQENRGGVRTEPIERFLSQENAVTWGIYRLVRENGISYGEKAAEYARNVAKQAVKFDADFKLMDGTELYCTELVWRAYLAAGIDIVDGKFDEVQIPMLGTDLAILPSRLEHSHHFYQVLYPQDLGENR